MTSFLCPRARRSLLSLQPFAHLEPSNVFFSLSPAFLSQNPPTFLTLCPSLVFPAQLPRAEPCREFLQPFLLLRGCLSLLGLLPFPPLPSPSATSPLGDGTQRSLPTLPGQPGALAAPSAAETRWSCSPAASVSPPARQGQPLQAGMAVAAGEGDRLGSFVAPHLPKLLPFRGAAVPGLPKAHP